MRNNNLLTLLGLSAGLGLDLAQAALIQGDSTSAGTLFESTAARTVAVGDQAGPEAKTDADATPSNVITWTLQNQSWFDEDTGYEYIEMTNTLTMPILSSDVITFHVEFTTT